MSAYSINKAHVTHDDTGWDPENSGRFWLGINLLPLPRIEAWSVGLLERSVAAIPIVLSRPQSLRKVQNFTLSEINK